MFEEPPLRPSFFSRFKLTPLFAPPSSSASASKKSASRTLVRFFCDDCLSPKAFRVFFSCSWSRAYSFIFSATCCVVTGTILRSGITFRIWALMSLLCVFESILSGTAPIVRITAWWCTSVPGPCSEKMCSRWILFCFSVSSKYSLPITRNLSPFSNSTIFVLLSCFGMSCLSSTMPPCSSFWKRQRMLFSGFFSWMIALPD
mmetsp:Transcript_499/g.1045  ORF Transcript_499/g.1045 Transcript_499/m.1045 type:complete len:202 (+) Transcript_499:502-1107(+)